LPAQRFPSSTLPAEAELAATDATVPALERARRQPGRLAVLLGRFGGSVEAEHEHR
jgi:hypothetical protein